VHRLFPQNKTEHTFIASCMLSCLSLSRTGVCTMGLAFFFRIRKHRPWLVIPKPRRSALVRPLNTSPSMSSCTIHADCQVGCPWKASSKMCCTSFTVCVGMIRSEGGSEMHGGEFWTRNNERTRTGCRQEGTIPSGPEDCWVTSKKWSGRWLCLHFLHLHTHTCTHAHTHMHTYTHTHIHTAHTHACMHAKNTYEYFFQQAHGWHAQC
jgi:hypothetical protein